MQGLSPRARQRFARRCRKLRDDAGLSQMDIAKRSDFGLRHYQRLESGEIDPRLSTLIRLAQVYGVDVTELVSGL